MGIHVNIGEAKDRLSELIAASERGEEVVIARAGKPVARLVPIAEAEQQKRREIAARRMAAFGMFKEAFEGYDLSLEALKADRPDPDERERRKFGSDL